MLHDLGDLLPDRSGAEWPAEQPGATEHQQPAVPHQRARRLAGLADAGYLFDNVIVTTGTGPASPGCDVTIDKQADAGTVVAGGLMGYRMTAQNRGSAVARNVQVCDHIPRHTTFVRADHTLRRVGDQRCLAIQRLQPDQRVSVHLTLHVDASAPPGRLTNIADVTPGLPGLRPLAAVASDLPGPLVRPGSARRGAQGQAGQGRRESPREARSTELHRIASVARHRLSRPRTLEDA